MFRGILYYVIPLLFPTLVYVLWMLYARYRMRMVHDGEMPEWERTPWLLLLGAGVALTAIVLFTVAFVTGGTPGQEYSPAQLRDGRIMPGRIE